MAVRGFLSGVFWGSVVAALGLGVVSQFVPLPQAPVTVPAAAPAPRVAPAPVVAPAPAAEVPAATAIPDDQATPAGPEVIADPAVALALRTATQAPLAPAAPDATDPAPAVPAATEMPSTIDTPTPLTAPAAEMLPPGASPQPARPAPVADAPTAMPTPDPSAPAPTVAAPVDGAAAALVAITPTPPAVDPQPAAAALPPPPPLTLEEQALLQPAPEAVPETAPEPLLVPDQPILRPVPGLGEGIVGVTTGRLPRIGDAPLPEPVAPVIAPPALVRFARPFDNPDAKPLFALILIDTGTPDLERARLAALPFPLTFAIDPLAPDAASAAALYRAAGQEVVMLATGIPQGATASDLEVTFAAHDAALPEAVAVLDLETGGFQNDRPLATEVVPVIKGLGRGLLTWDKGLNAGDQVARRDRLAAAVIFRRLDGDAESIPTMKRYLDRAAFKAAQDGNVAVVGTTRPETIAAILEWTVEGRAASLALAPVTAVLTTP
ncbi:MAG: divergent polysaccharide deacetylase family protein [Pseudorhodobacter sp.]|nr:divergent polysaccharide deacetylase family protein [Pseudorhodobacter sp.]